MIRSSSGSRLPLVLSISPACGVAHSSLAYAATELTSAARCYFLRSARNRHLMRVMTFTWLFILVGGIAYFSVIGLLHN
jgi:hypothetical protein